MGATRRVLDGIRVLDHSHVIAGSYCGRLLAELGAEVIKIEPVTGERFRYQRPFVNGESLLYTYINANKKSVTLNLKSEQGKKMLFDLVRKSDVFVENYAPGAMDRLGVGYQEQVKVNPRIIYVSVTGFGNQGPYKDLVAFDYLIQAMLGLIDANGFPDRRVRIGPAVTDWGSGTFAALSVLAALYHRERTNEGQRVDISMFDVGFMFLIEHLSYAAGSLPVRVGNRFQTSAPSNVYDTKDGQIYASIYTDDMWTKFLRRIGREDLLNEQRFGTSWDRALSVDEVDKVVGDWAAGTTTSEALADLRALGAACGRVSSVIEAFDDPHVKARELLRNVKHERMGDLLIPGSALKLSKTPGRVDSGGSPLGAHNEEVYSRLLGYTREEIQRLKEQKVI
ncbi:MAG: CoA transferase [Nitrososphaerota archaeon]|nr:CoA transferase [Nitrososphaerota archaeon]